LGFSSWSVLILIQFVTICRSGESIAVLCHDVDLRSPAAQPLIRFVNQSLCLTWPQSFLNESTESSVALPSNQNKSERLLITPSMWKPFLIASELTFLFFRALRVLMQKGDVADQVIDHTLKLAAMRSRFTKRA
jgi:hypothetical protein